MPKKNDPLTPEEMADAADIFFPLYDIIAERIKDATVEDRLKIMENVAKLGHKRRTDKRLEEQSQKFGFNKNEDTEEEDTDA